MKKTLLSLLLLSQLTFFSFAQVLLEQDAPPKGSVPGKLVINGSAQELQDKLKNVIIILYQDIGKTGNWVELEKLLTKADGKFSFKLDLESKYMIEVARGGYTTKKVTFDTEVYQLTNQPAPFDFIVDLVPDRDGLGYINPVGNVFYYAKKKEFDYQLDYSKEELEEEAKLERERLEKLEFQRKAAEEKALRELQAKELITSEQSTGQEKIENAIKAGNGDKSSTINALKRTFLETDTLAEKKAEAIYVAYEKQKSTGGVVNYGALFEEGKKTEKQIVAAKEEEIKKVQEQIRIAKEDIAKKEKEALEKQKEAAAVEMKGKLEAAETVQQAAREKAETEQKQKIEQAIKTGAGNKEETIKQLAGIYSKDDIFKDAKAIALYETYEKQKLSGTALSNLDYSALFAAANFAEIKAQDEAEQKQSKEQKARVDEYVQKVNEKSAKEEAAAVTKIEEAVKSSGGDKAKLIEAFKQTFDKDDPFAEHKATAMFEKYEADRKILQEQGKNYATVDYKSIFTAGKQAELTAVDAERKKKEEALAKSEVALYMAMEQKRKERQEESKKAEVGVEKVREEKLQQTKSEQEKKIQTAFTLGAGNREATVVALKSALPANTPYRDEKAAAMFEQYERDVKKAQEAGQPAIGIDFKSLQAAADLVEVQQLQKSFEQKKATEVAEQEKRRVETEQKAKEILASKSEAAQVMFADAGKQKEEAEVKAEQEKRVKEELAKAAEEKRIKDEAEAKAKAEEEKKAKEEATRLAEEKRKKDEVAKAKAEEEARLAADAKKSAEEAKQKAAEEKRLAEEASAKAKADEATRLAEEKRQKEEAAKAKAEEEARLAAEAKKSAEEAKQKAEEEKRLAEQVAAKAKADELARLAEEKRISEIADAKAKSEAEQKRKDEEAARLAEAKRLKEEADAKAKVEADKKAAEEAASLAEAKRLKEEADAKAKLEAEKKAAEESARLAEQKRIQELAEAKAREEAAKAAEAKRIKDEADAKARAEAEKKAREDAARLAEEKRIRDEAEAKAKVLADAKRLEEEKLRAEEYKKAQEEAKRMSEAERKKLFEAAQERAKNTQLDEKARRAQFLSDIALIYPEGLTEENIDGKDFKLKRYIINDKGTVTVYDKKTWNWGGIFCFKNTDIAITESLFEMEVKKYKAP